MQNLTQQSCNIISEQIFYNVKLKSTVNPENDTNLKRVGLSGFINFLIYNII